MNSNKLKVLLAEDDENLRIMLKDVICKLKLFDVFAVECAEDANLMLDEEQFAIAIIDLNLCGSVESGIELAEKIKKMGFHTTIVISTGYYDYLFNMRLVNLPIDDFIRKPINISFFSEKLLLWATLYRHKVVNNEYINTRMKKYEVCLDTLNDLEKRLKVLCEGLSNGGN